MQTLSDSDKLWQLEQALKSLPRSLCKDPKAAAMMVVAHPLVARWTVTTPDAVGGHG